MPFNSKIDVLGTSFNKADWYPNGKEFGKQIWRTTNAYHKDPQYGEARYTSNSKMWSRGASGYALKMNFKNDSGPSIGRRFVDWLDLYMYYTVTPRGNPKRIDAYGGYAHQETTLQITPSISFSGTSISISPVKSFTYHSNTMATRSF